MNSNMEVNHVSAVGIVQMLREPNDLPGFTMALSAQLDLEPLVQEQLLILKCCMEAANLGS